MVEIYTDGSAMKHRSGWGFVAVAPDGERYCTFSGTEPGATNQKMELTAAVEALKWWKAGIGLEPEDDTVTLFSDSAYLVNCYNEGWWKRWINEGWQSSAKTPVANQELWQALIPFFLDPRVQICKVTAHTGHAYNELADKLAKGTYRPKEEIKTNKYDTISIELSNILLSFQTGKRSYKETIREIINLMIREGVKMDGEYYSNPNN